MNERRPRRITSTWSQDGETVTGPIELPLSGGQISQCCLDYAFTLALSMDHGFWTIRIENDFKIKLPSGEQHDFPALGGGDSASPSTFGPAVDLLLHAEVAASAARQDGSLTLSTASRIELEVRPHEQWESWLMRGPAGEEVKCVPGVLSSVSLLRRRGPNSPFGREAAFGVEAAAHPAPVLESC